MNQDVLSGKWKQMSGAVRQLRGRLTNSDREIVMGHLLRTVGVLQERRGLVTGRLERARRRLVKHARA